MITLSNFEHCRVCSHDARANGASRNHQRMALTAKIMTQTAEIMPSLLKMRCADVIFGHLETADRDQTCRDDLECHPTSKSSLRSGFERSSIFHLLTAQFQLDLGESGSCNARNPFQTRGRQVQYLIRPVRRYDTIRGNEEHDTSRVSAGSAIS